MKLPSLPKLKVEKLAGRGMLYSSDHREFSLKNLSCASSASLDHREFSLKILSCASSAFLETLSTSRSTLLKSFAKNLCARRCREGRFREARCREERFNFISGRETFATVTNIAKKNRQKNAMTAIDARLRNLSASQLGGAPNS